MSIADEINRISTQKNIIRDKMRDMGIIEQTASPSIDVLAATLRDDVRIDTGSTVRTVLEGDSITIDAGYYKTKVTVNGVTNVTADKQKIMPIANPIKPTKTKQDYNVPEGYYGFGSFTVKAIGDEYKDTSDADLVTDDDVLSGKIFYNKDGRQIGKMTDYGSMDLTIDYNNALMPIPFDAGYYGAGEIGVACETEVREVTPSNSDINVVPNASNGHKFLLGVKVKGDENLKSANIADGVTIFGKAGEFTKDATIDYTTENTSPDVYEGKTAYVKGKKVTGTLKNRGLISETIDGLTKTSFLTNNSGYYSMIHVKLSDDIETELAKI